MQKKRTSVTSILLQVYTARGPIPKYFARRVHPHS